MTTDAVGGRANAAPFGQAVRIFNFPPVQMRFGAGGSARSGKAIKGYSAKKSAL
jgi:hypothetical protein